MPDQVTRGAARAATLASIPAALLAGALLLWLTGGFGAAPDGAAPDGGARPASPRPQSTAPVSVPAPELSERAATVCRTLLSRLPGSLRELSRRPVTAGPGQNAAYGDPAIVLACGGPPAAYPPDALFWGMSKVCWYADERPDGSVWTAIDREVPVTVTVPGAYTGAGAWVNEFSATLIATVPPKPLSEMPSGCR